jgi:hypothetical protein
MRHGDHFAFCADITSYHLHTYPRWMVRPGGRRAYAETSRQHTTYSFLSLSLEIPVVDRRGRCPSRDSETRTFFY